MSASIGSRFAAGAGVTLTPQSAPRFVPEEHGMNSRLLAEIDKIAEEGIREGAYPGCQVVVLKDGREMYNKAFGTHVWNEAGSKALPVKENGCVRHRLADKDHGHTACCDEVVRWRTPQSYRPGVGLSAFPTGYGQEEYYGTRTADA